jgi:hypothetical protein
VHDPLYTAAAGAAAAAALVWAPLSKERGTLITLTI